jgi:hypothetical protein
MKTERKELIYLACPYTHNAPEIMEERYKSATSAAARLIEKGHVVFSPITMTHPIDKILAKGILPVDHPDSTDQTCNGVSLCTLHHRAFDRGFVTFDVQFKTHLDESQAEEFKNTGHDGGIDDFRKLLRPLLILPPDKKERPKAEYIAAVNVMRGWEL